MKKIYPPRHTVPIAMRKSLHKKVKILAKKHELSVSSYIRTLILAAIRTDSKKTS